MLKAAVELLSARPASLVSKRRRAATQDGRSSFCKGNLRSLELEPDPNLAFTARKVLQSLTNPWRATLCLKDVAGLRTERADIHRIVRAGRLEPIYCSRVIAIKEIEHLEEHLSFDALPKVEPLRETHVQINEGGCGLRVPSVESSLTVEVEALTVEQTISVKV